MKLESKIGKVNKNQETVYNFLSDFSNFEHLIPADKVKNWESTAESCSFEIDMLGKTGFKIVEKEPFKLIKLTDIEGSKFGFFFWIQIKQMAENDSRIKLTMDVDLNPMMQMMAKKPLQNFLNTLIEQMENMTY